MDLSMNFNTLPAIDLSILCQRADCTAIIENGHLIKAIDNWSGNEVGICE